MENKAQDNEENLQRYGNWLVLENKSIPLPKTPQEIDECESKMINKQIEIFQKDGFDIEYSNDKI